jgi:subtilisin family serine protease
MPEGGLSVSQAIQQQQSIFNAQNIVKQLTGVRARVTAQYKSIPYMALEVDAEALQKLLDIGGISIEEDVPVPAFMASSNPVIGSNEAWAAGYTGSGWTVAVLDTGVDKTHPYFSTGGNKVVSEACYSSNYSPYSFSVCPGGVEASTSVDSGADCVEAADGYPKAMEQCQHGTHIAGSIAGNDTEGPNYGVAKDADIIAIQVFSLFPTLCGGRDCALSWTSDQIRGLERVYELRNDFDIAAVNMSLGGGRYFDPCESDSRKAIIDQLRSVGIATVIASGNFGDTNAISAPACIPTAVSVGATK